MKGNKFLGVIVFCLIMASVFLFYQKEASGQTIDYIEVTNVPDGDPLPGGSVPVCFQELSCCSAYNDTLGYIDTVSANWTAEGGNAMLLGPTPAVMNGIDVGNISGTVWFNASYFDGTNWHNDSVVYDVIPPTVDYITIRDEPGNRGDWIGPSFYILWEIYTFYAAGYNTTFGYIDDVSVTWNCSNESVGTVSSPGPSTTFYTVGEGTCVVTADYGNGITNDTGVLTVAMLDEIIVRDAPNGGGDPVLNRTYFVGDNDTFWAAGYNNTYGYIGDVGVMDWWSSNQSVGTIIPEGDPPGQNMSTSAIFQAVGGGVCVISVYHMGIMNSTGLITVLTYDVDYIVIRDSPRGDGSPVGDGIYKVGDGDVFYAAGYNFTGGYVGDVSVNWSSDNESVGTVTTNDTYTSFSAIGPGTCIVTADYKGGITNVTGTLTVAEVDYILIRDGPDNDGSEVGDRFYFTWSYGEYYYAAAYNDTHGYLGGVHVTWMSSNESVGTVDDSTSGSFTYFDPVGDGTCIVTANYGGITDETGTITVSSATVDYIQIRDAPNGLGDVVIDPIYILGSVDNYYGALYNHTFGYLCEVSSRPDHDSYWSSSNTSVVTITAPNTSATITCNDTNTGTAVITLWAYGRSNSTTVTVVNWTIEYISIMDAPDGLGDFVGDITYDVCETDTFYAAGFNYTHGYVIDINASWECDDPNAGTVTSPGVYSVFTAKWVTADSSCQVTASYDTLSNVTGTLTVLSPRTDYVQIRSDDNGGGAVISSISYYKGNIDTYYGAKYNNTVGFFGSVPQSSNWTSTNTSIVDVTNPGNYSTVTCSPTNSGTVTITLDDGDGHTNSTTVTVLAYTVDYILIRDSPLGGGIDLSESANYPSYPVGHATTFYGAMYNDSVGYLCEVASISIWTSSNTNIVEASTYGVFSFITCSDTNYGTVTVTIFEWMGHSATTQVTVLKPTADYLKIMNAPGGAGNEVDDMLYIIGNTDVFYAAVFNSTAGYFEDVSVTWKSDNESVGTADPSFGSSTNFTGVGRGTCVVTADLGGGISDSTGTLTVTLPSNITVDDSGGAHFTSIQEAIDNANDGNTVYVYSGTYFEHLTINKSIILMGEDRQTTIIDGGGYGKVIYVSGDDVSISGFTIQNGEYGIYCDESDSITINYNTIRDYDYGIYNFRTTDGWIIHNKIISGQYGIYTYKAYNDAFRYNEISYNTLYGAKDYNSQLKNCFNWNTFYHNYIAYYYDPDQKLPVLEFDGNILEDNYIAIMVENASTISITNNTATRNEYGFYLINASPNIADNIISHSKYGIYAGNSSPPISNNMISEISQYGIYAKFGDSLRIANNTIVDTKMIIFNSTVKELWLKDSTIIQVNSNIEDIHLDATSAVEVGWFLQIGVVDGEGKPVEGAAILINDAYDTVVSTHITDSEGYTKQILVIESLQDSTSTIDYNPYRITVVKGSLESSTVLTINEDTDVTIILSDKETIIKPSSSPFPWGLILVIGFIGAIGLAGLGIEVMKYGILTLFLPLYSRIRKQEVLDQPTRERIYGYIIGNPGAHFGLIKEDLDLGSGQLVYHLKQLKQAHLIYSREDGVKRRFYPANIPGSRRGPPQFSDIQEKILGIIKNNSGIDQKKIASTIGTSRQVAGYHLTKMERKGVIKKEVVGRKSRYYASETTTT